MNKSLMRLALCLLLLSSACAEKQVEARLDAKVATEPWIPTSANLQDSETDLISQSSLNQAKKEQLRDLQYKTNQTLFDLRSQSLELRSILIKDVFAKDYDRKEVKLIQRKIEKIESKRVAVIFDTIDKANQIFGRQSNAEESQALMDRAMFGQ